MIHVSNMEQNSNHCHLDACFNTYMDLRARLMSFSKPIAETLRKPIPQILPLGKISQSRHNCNAYKLFRPITGLIDLNLTSREKVRLDQTLLILGMM